MRAAVLVSMCRLLLGACAMAAVTTSPAHGQVGDSWPMSGGDPAHTGVAEGPRAPYRRVWSRELSDHGPVAGPVVQDGTVVVVSEESLVAISGDTGQVQWTIPRRPGPAGPAAISGERVLYAEGTGSEGEVVAVSLSDGTKIWRFPTRSPVVGGVTVDGGRGYVGGRDGRVHALDLETGEDLWSFEASGRVETAPAVAGGLLLVVAEGFKTGRATAHAIDVETGEEEWSFTPERVALGASSVTIGDDLALFGLGDLRIHALELRTGEERWSGRSRAPFSARTIPAFAGDFLIGDRVGHFYRLAATSGREVWIFRVPGGLLRGSPVVAGDTALIGDSSGQVSAVALESGRVVWKEQMGERPVLGIAAANDRLFVSVGGGSVVALEHDAGGALIDEASPTTLFVGRALLNFAAAAVPLIFGLATLFRWVGNRRRRLSSGTVKVGR